MFYMDDGKVKQYSSYDIDKNYYLAPIETSIKKDQSEEFTFTARLYPNENKIESVRLTLRFSIPISNMGNSEYLSDSVSVQNGKTTTVKYLYTESGWRIKGGQPE